MNPSILCTTIACLTVFSGPNTVKQIGQYTVIKTNDSIAYCRKLSPMYDCIVHEKWKY